MSIAGLFATLLSCFTGFFSTRQELPSSWTSMSIHLHLTKGNTGVRLRAPLSKQIARSTIYSPRRCQFSLWERGNDRILILIAVFRIKWFFIWCGYSCTLLYLLFRSIQTKNSVMLAFKEVIAWIKSSLINKGMQRNSFGGTTNLFFETFICTYLLLIYYTQTNEDPSRKNKKRIKIGRSSRASYRSP